MKKALARASALFWLGWPDLNRRMQESKSCALPLGDTPILIFTTAIVYHKKHALSSGIFGFSEKFGYAAYRLRSMPAPRMPGRFPARSCYTQRTCANFSPRRSSKIDSASYRHLSTVIYQLSSFIFHLCRVNRGRAHCDAREFRRSGHG